MKISAHASDLQKSETRSWQLSQQVSDLQDTITSLNLQLARKEEEVRVDKNDDERCKNAHTTLTFALRHRSFRTMRPTSALTTLPTAEVHWVT
jgi:uncharacterized protein (DUF3084 family)